MAIREDLTDNSQKDNTGDSINGSEVDVNPQTLANILDGDTQTDMAQDDRVDFRVATAHTTSIEAIRLICTDAAAGSIKDSMVIEWDPSDGSNLTDGSSGVGVVFTFPDSGDAQNEVASIDVVNVDDTATSEDARIDLRVIRQGTVATVATFGGQDTFFDFIQPVTTHTASTNVYNLYVRSSAAQTVPAGTTTLVATARFDEPNITATGTVTSAATVYIADAPTEGGTNNFALWVDSGAVKLDGALTVDGLTTHGGNVVSDTDSTDDLGTTSVRWANVYTDSIGDSGQNLINAASSMTMPNAPMFLAVGAAGTNVTGDGTSYTVTYGSEIFDRGSNFSSPSFTAPVTGAYVLGGTIQLTGVNADSEDLDFAIVTSNRTYVLYQGTSVNILSTGASVGAGVIVYSFSTLADMDAADTANMRVRVFDGSKEADVGVTVTLFWGVMVA
jgi:hypothetical protein